MPSLILVISGPGGYSTLSPLDLLDFSSLPLLHRTAVFTGILRHSRDGLVCLEPRYSVVAPC
jgi:hypothetical protein